MNTHIYDTEEAALQELKNNPSKYNTLDSLKKLQSEVSSHSEGKVTILYSGADEEVLAAIKANPDARMIGKSAASKFLGKDEFIEAVANAMDVDIETYNTRNTPLNEIFNGTRDGDFWNELSRRFVQETKGQVYGLTGVSPPERIWAQTELPELLQNPNVTHIEGLKRTELLQSHDDLILAGKTPEAALDAIRAKVSTQADHHLRSSDMVLDPKNGTVKWVQTSQATNGAIPDTAKPDGINTTNAQHFDNKLNANLNSTNPKTAENARAVQTLRQNNPQVVTESLETLRSLPNTPERQAAIDTMAHQGSTKGIYNEPHPVKNINTPNSVVQNLRANGASGDLIEHVLHAKPEPSQSNTPFHEAHKRTLNNLDHEPAHTKRLVEPSPPLGMSTHQAVTAEQAQRQTAELQEINRPAVAAEAQTRSAQAALQNQIKAESFKTHIPQAVKPITHVGAVEAVSKTPDISIKPTVPKGLIGELADSPAVKLAGKAATPLAIAAGAYALGKQVSDGIANETTAQGKVSVGTSVAANTLLETGVGAVGAAYGTVEGWVVGAGDYGENGLLGAAIGAGAGAKHRSAQLVADFKATSIENTIKTTAADWTDTGFKAYNGSAFEHTVNTVSSKTNAFIATSNQALNDVSNTISQTYQNSGAAPYVNRAAQFTEHATQSAAQAVKPATDYVSNKLDVVGNELNGYWNRLTQTEIAQKLTNGYNKTVADTNQDLNRAGIPTGEPAAQTPAQPQAQTAPAPKPIEMGMGANGKGVKQVQQALNALGANIHTDGHFGKSTAQALQAFQRVHHRQLKVDGTVGDNDISVIHQALKRQAHIKNGQSNLNELGADLKVKGRMDKTTVAAVKEFQTEHHLKATGTLNNATQKALGHEVQEQRQTHIKQIQTALNELGAELTVDGHIGKATVAAVKYFQTEHHLKATGKLDGSTINAMNQALQTQQQQQQSPARTTEPAPMQPSLATPNAAQPAVSPEQNKQVEQMINALSSTPAFGALPPEVQKAMAAQMMEAAQAVSPQPQVPSQVQAPTPNNADTAILAPNAYTPPATQPVQMTARMADLHEQITQQFGNQLDHLSAKDKNSALAMTTQAAVSMSAKSIDYIHVNDEGKVLMGFNNNVGYSNSVNLNDAPKLDAQSVLADTVSLQQTQQADVAQRQVEKQAHAGLGMSR